MNHLICISRPWHAWLFSTIFFGQFMLLWMTQVSLDSFTMFLAKRVNQGRTHKDSAVYDFKKTNDTTSRLHVSFENHLEAEDFSRYHFFFGKFTVLWIIHFSLDNEDFSSKLNLENNFESSLDFWWVDFSLVSQVYNGALE